MDAKEFIAKRTAKFFKDGDLVNLGIGMPTKCMNYINPDYEVWFQSENGVIGMTGAPKEGDVIDPDIVDAGGAPTGIREGGCCFSSFTSFGYIRGGHVDYTVLGAYEVDQEGNLANWMIPGKLTPGMGGAMDLVVGAKRVIVAMEHTQKGNHKIMKQCTLPLTAAHQVNMIITEMGVMDVTPEGLVLKEINPEFTVEQVQEATEAKLIVAKDLKPMAQ